MEGIDFRALDERTRIMLSHFGSLILRITLRPTKPFDQHTDAPLVATIVEALNDVSNYLDEATRSYLVPALCAVARHGGDLAYRISPTVSPRDPRLGVLVAFLEFAQEGHDVIASVEFAVGYSECAHGMPPTAMATPETALPAPDGVSGERTSYGEVETWKDHIDDEDLEAIVAYVRSHGILENALRLLNEATASTTSDDAESTNSTEA